MDQRHWSPANPSFGQCASTALVLQDLLAGELLLADVRAADGAQAGVHFWNRMANGSELDLTRDQFRSGEQVGQPRQVSRPAELTRGRLPGQYHLLSHRVSRLLNGGEPASAAWPVTIKAVYLDPQGRALLCRNRRGGWELPSGRPTVGEVFQDSAAREVKEETGLTIRTDRLLGAETLQVTRGAWVDMVAYECLIAGQLAPETLRASKEHTSVAFIDPMTLPDNELPPIYKRLISATGRS